MDYIDQKYINQVSVYLRNFKRKSSNNFNFSCPFCGDSKKVLSKARGYIYEKRGKLNFYCHNCGKSCGFKNFLRFIDESIYNDYCMEKFNIGRTSYGGVGIKTDIQPIVQARAKIELGISSIQSLSSIHPVKKYIEARNIPDQYYNILYYTPTFQTFIRKFSEKFSTLVNGDVKNMVHKETISNLPNDKRIVIPFYKETNDLFMIQGRFFSGFNSLSYRYVTISLYGDSDLQSYPKIYGMERWNPKKPTYIVEGPLDSLFLDNCLAIGGSTINLSLPFFNKFDPENTIFIFDNEPYNREIVKRMYMVIRAGYKIFIWPRIQSKDINDFIVKGGSTSLFYDQSRIFSGIRANLEMLKFLKKV